MSNRYVPPAQGLDDYYAILQISPSANLNEIKAAWRRLALAKHPDKNPSPNATAEFQLLQEAYSTLSEPRTRQAYDVKYRESQITSETNDPQPHSNEKNQDGNKGTQSMLDMYFKIQRLRSQLNKTGGKLRSVTQFYHALLTEIRRLDVEIRGLLEATTMRDESGNPNWNLNSSYFDMWMERAAYRTERGIIESEMRRYHEQMSSLMSQITMLSAESNR
ncbi:hypothetical protein N7520_006060 [Penicillium odoratum]|uniref:uncharacterized protein n=1 Tax=Penicillium odoratum TaxID=1167516 RepID=UPI0025477847|nr:uncharacterized protein N7520_006060 [Penicillium odoratum]KAJ5758904.1 hypothetical protein N7520_006060 [Penicillium odoratum]